MKYDEIDDWILNAKTNTYEQKHKIETISIGTILKKRDIAFKRALKSDDTYTFFICFKMNRDSDNWTYIAPTKSQAKLLKKQWKYYYEIDEKNKMIKNKKKESKCTSDWM